CLTAPAFAQAPPARGAAPASAAKVLPPGAKGGVLAVRRVSLPALTQEEITRARRGKRTRVGQNRSLPSRPLAGDWARNSDGQWYWSTAIQADSAGGVRLHFRAFDIGGGRVWI